MIYESFGSCGNIGPKDRVKHMCSKSSGKQRPSKWRKHKDAYSKLLGTGPYDMIFVKGRGEFLKKLKILSKLCHYTKIVIIVNCDFFFFF